MQHLKESINNNGKLKSKITMLQAFKTIIWPRRKLVFVGLILIIIRSLSGLVLPWQSKVLLDEVVPNKEYTQLYPLIGIVIAAISIQAITSFLLTRIPSLMLSRLYISLPGI